MDRKSLLAGVVLALFSSQLIAGDFPQWRGPERDGKVAGFEAPAQWPAAPETKWTVKVGLGDAGPAVVGESVFTFAREGNDEVIACYDAATGEQKWKSAYPSAAFNGPDARQHAGPRATPAVSDGKVVTVGVSGVLSCVNAADGQLAWRKDEYKGVPKFHTSSSPLITGGVCIVQLGSAEKGGIHAFDLATGESKWEWTGGGPDYASPVLLEADGTRQVVAMTAREVVGVSLADGKLLWSVPFVSEGRNYNSATPVVDGATVYIAGQGRGTKALRIEKSGDAFAAKELWSKPDLAVQYATPVLVDGRLYGLSDKGNIYCMDAKTGDVLWTDDARRGGYGAILTDVKTILLLTEKGDLVIFAADAKQFTQLASYKVSEMPTYATPAITGADAIYLKTQDSLAKLSVK